MPLDFQRARPLLQQCDLPKLFIEELGWEPCRQRLTLRVGESDYALTAIAEKRGFIAWLCESPQGGLPDHATRLKLDRKLSETNFEHLIVFVTVDRSRQSWMWVRREPGKPLAARTHEYQRHQPGDSLLQKLQILYVSLEEEEAGLSTIAVAGRARAAFDIERVTKAFYRDFDTHRKAFLKFIDGIAEIADREWYASVMLNRLMFVYFIQRKGFLDADPNYLRNRLDRCKKEQGKDKFYSFYRYFLLRLFHEGFGKRRKDRASDLEKLLGNIPYLNGGLFDVHELEKPERYGKDIQIPDKAFEHVFNFFEEWDWQLDPHRTVKKSGDKEEINPDVLGYIFEKYINGIQPGEQKAKGAYYTKEDITEYISKNTVLPFLLDAARSKCKVAFENPNGPTVWDLLRENPDRYIYPAVRHGVTWNYLPDLPAKGAPLAKPLDLPPQIAAGLDATRPNLIERRKAWNKPAPREYALPTEIWREVVARRQRYEEVRRKLAAGEVREVNDFITLNLDLRQFAQDVITNSEGPELLRAVWHAIEQVTVLDPTCGSGAFLFAALNILEPLYEGCLDRMEAFVADDDRIRPRTPEESIRELIASGESLCLEFKSTARWNVKEGRADKAMEQVIIKTVAAFLNSSGGDLLVGVQDDGSIVGIEADQQLFNADKRNRDTYENWLMTQLLGAYGKQHTANLRVSFARLGEHDVCRVTVLPASSAVYVEDNNQEALYVRSGNSTRSLSTSEAVAYHQQRFAQFKPPLVAAKPLKSSSPKKYADFRKVLETVAVHPNLRYFVLKSIILNNLFGVDIMEEAVEICKLRLFLKLAAQVDPRPDKDNFGIEPLPDIDFNIRAGNTLVGYATADEVRRCMKESGGGQKKLMYEEDQATFERFNIRCADVEQAFTKFRQLQTEGDGSVPAADKLELQKRLKALEVELNRHLAGEYGVKVSDKAAYAKWVKSHQPFHWFIQFYGILNSGGFDVVIGNPPYVEYVKVKSDYCVLESAYSCLPCGNLYALVIERCCCMVSKGARVGMIVQLSAICTDRMQPLQACYLRHASQVWASCYDDRPGKLFDGLEHIRATVLLSQHVASKTPQVCTTNLLRWYSEHREGLFPLLQYGIVSSDCIPGSFPKMGEPDLRSIVAKTRATQKTLEWVHRLGSADVVHYYRSPLYWIRSMDFLPHFDSGAAARSVHHFKDFGLSDKRFGPVVGCIVNSTLFYIWFIAYGNGRNVALRDISTFPSPRSLFADASLAAFRKLFSRLMADYQNNSLVRKRNDGVEFQEFYPSKSKPILDEIDTVLAGHYEFTGAELDFILHYDIKYRLGRGTETEEE